MKCHLINQLIIICFLISVHSKEIIETVEAVAGRNVELPCNVTAEKTGDKLTILAWYRNGTPTAFYSSRDLRGEGKSGGGGKRRYRLIETGESVFLQMSGVRASDSGLYFCLADFDSSPAHKTYSHLIVIEPPLRLWVVQENGSQVVASDAVTSHDLGPLYVGDKLHLFCVAFGGMPRPKITWWTGGHLLKNTAVALSERRMRSELQFGPLRREDHGRVLTCRAANNDVAPPLSVDITLDMHLSPQLVSVNGTEGAVRAGDPIQLQCRVLGARPPPDILWRFNEAQYESIEQNITVEAAQRLVLSDMELTASFELDEARVTCCAKAYQRDQADRYICAEGITLSITYPPVVEITSDDEINNNTLPVVMGSNVMLNCSNAANPPVHEYSWYLNKENIDKNGKTSSPAQDVLLIEAVEEIDAGVYSCSAENAEGLAESTPLIIDVTYPASCTNVNVEEYGLGNESINITCPMKANPTPERYRWVFLQGTNFTDFENISERSVTFEDSGSVLQYTRPSDVGNGTIICWGLNGIPDTDSLPSRPCVYIITDETPPKPPSECRANKNTQKDITISCEEGHNGGLEQKFTLIARTLETGSNITSITNVVPKFIVNVDSIEEDYQFIIVAFNAKGDSAAVVIDQADVVDENAEEPEPENTVTNITTLSLALCGGVALLALVACGLVLCAREKAVGADLPRAPSTEPALCAYNTEESNCETCHSHDSDEGSECHVRRSESFRKAVGARQSPRSYDVRRTSSFHSARGEGAGRDAGKRERKCRVHSLQNISRRREMDILCDHLAGYLPVEAPHYYYQKPSTTFYTMPRKQRHRTKEISDEASEATQNSDGFSLPPPPDEFSSYRAGTRITAKDMPKPRPYTAELRSGADPMQYNNVIISPMNTVGLPTVSGETGLYTYPDEEAQDINTMRTTGTMSTFQSNYASPKESGF